MEKSMNVRNNESSGWSCSFTLITKSLGWLGLPICRQLMTSIFLLAPLFSIKNNDDCSTYWVLWTWSVVLVWTFWWPPGSNQREISEGSGELICCFIGATFKVWRGYTKPLSETLQNCEEETVEAIWEQTAWACLLIHQINKEEKGKMKAYWLLQWRHNYSFPSLDTCVHILSHTPPSTMNQYAK